MRRLTDKGKVCAALILVLGVSWVALSTALQLELLSLMRKLNERWLLKS